MQNKQIYTQTRVFKKKKLLECLANRQKKYYHLNIYHYTDVRVKREKKNTFFKCQQ
jgi:hypothetical protein